MRPLKLSAIQSVERRQFLWAGGIGLLSGFGKVDAAQSRSSLKSRIVCVGGGITEIICALGYESSLVGVDTTSRYPLSVRHLPSVGYARHLSLEGVLALAPQQVIVGHDAGPLAVLSRLREASVLVSRVEDGHTLDALIARVKQIGQLLKCVGQAQALIENLNLEWDALRQTLAIPAHAIRVMFVLGQTPSQMLVAGTDTGADAMLKHAGLQNAFSDFRGYRPVTAEAIIAAQPDLVVLTQPDALTPKNGPNSRSLIHQFTGLFATPAARPSRWLVFDTMFLLSFGPRLPDAILTLRRASIEAMRT